MLYKRQEPFRYSFAEPLIGEIFCVEDGEVIISNEKHSIDIIDLSPGGMKIRTNNNYTPSNKLSYSIQFSLGEDLIQTTAKIVWKTNQFYYFNYGLKLDQNTEDKKEIIELLKNYAKKQLLSKKLQEKEK